MAKKKTNKATSDAAAACTGDANAAGRGDAINIPDRLFKPPMRTDTTEPTTDAMIAQTESALGIKLPAALRAVLAVRNGGLLRLSNFKLADKPPKKWSTSRDYHIGQLPGVHPTHDSGLIAQTTLARREWDLPDGLFPLCGDGHRWCCLDYRACGPAGEPSLTHYDTEAGYEFAIAPSLAALLGGLHRKTDDLEPALIALDDGAPRGEALHVALLKLGCTKFDYPGSTPNPKFPHPPTWTWSKYKGLVRGLECCIQAENNKLFSVSIQKTPSRPDRHPMLTVSVSPKQVEKCLAEILTALGPSAVLIHGVD